MTDFVEGVPDSPRASIAAYLHPQVAALLFLGFSAGVPLLLIFATLSLWLREAGVERAAVTYFSWAALGYSFKFVWAPLVDKLPLPILTKRLGQRRGWMLVAQIAVMAAIALMAFTDPAAPDGLALMAVGAVALGFSSATQDIVIDAYRIEAADASMQALLSSAYVAGYRCGMLVAGAVALYLAAGFGSTAESYSHEAWKLTYLCMAAAMLVGVATTLVVREPVRRQVSSYFHGAADYARFLALFALVVSAFVVAFVGLGGLVDAAANWLSDAGLPGELPAFICQTVRLAGALAIGVLLALACVATGVVRMEMVQDTYIAPVTDFFSRYGRAAIAVLLLVGFYRVSDIVLGVIANVFYYDVGYSKETIATATKVFGLWMTILGGFLGGWLAIKFGVMRVLMLGAILAAATNLLFVALAMSPGDLPLLYGVIAADNLTAGLASAAFIAYLSSLTSISFTAVQYAIFSSLMTLFPKLLGGYTGGIVEAFDYPVFFVGTAVIGIPVLFLVAWVMRNAPPGGEGGSRKSP
ncbi:MAG: MFS transporter [Gammaproteobacteria bacterium]|nr:MFS transporter [Gammaproteobacteria bacterium]